MNRCCSNLSRTCLLSSSSAPAYQTHDANALRMMQRSAADRRRQLSQAAMRSRHRHREGAGSPAKRICVRTTLPTGFLMRPTCRWCSSATSIAGTYRLARRCARRARCADRARIRGFIVKQFRVTYTVQRRIDTIEARTAGRRSALCRGSCAGRCLQRTRCSGTRTPARANARVRIASRTCRTSRTSTTSTPAVRA